MSSEKNKSNQIITIIVGGLVTLLVGGSAPWWWSELVSSPKEEPVVKEVEEDKTEVLEEDKAKSNGGGESSQLPQDIESIKLKIERATVEDNNSWSSNYGPEKTVDNNISFGNYWSTADGAIIEVTLNFFLEEVSTVSEIHFLSTRNDGTYTQPQALNLAFIGESGEKIAERDIQVKTPNTEWERNDFDPVTNVSSIRLQLLNPLNDTGSYMTLNEIQFYGFPLKE